MRRFLIVLTFALAGLLLPGAPAFAQTKTPEAPPTLPAAPSPDAGSHGETPSDAEPVTVEGTIERPNATASAATLAVDEPPATPTIAGRERAYVHKGFYLAVRTDIGGLSVWGDGPAGSASLSGFASGGSLAIGGSPVPGFAIAGVIGSTTTSGTFNGGPTVVSVTTMTGGVQRTLMPPPNGGKGNARASSFLLGVLGDWFPVPTGGWHVGGAVGLGGASVTDDTNNTIAGASVAGSVFGGYQWWLGSSWSLGLSGFLSVAPSLDMKEPTMPNAPPGSTNNDSGYHMMPLSAGLQGVLLYY